jgi:hypothetical protein
MPFVPSGRGAPLSAQVPSPSTVGRASAAGAGDAHRSRSSTQRSPRATALLTPSNVFASPFSRGAGLGGGLGGGLPAAPLPVAALRSAGSSVPDSAADAGGSPDHRDDPEDLQGLNMNIDLSFMLT